MSDKGDNPISFDVDEEALEERHNQPGEFAIIVEVARHREFESREHAEQAADKMAAHFRNSSTFSNYEIGRTAVKRLE